MAAMFMFKKIVGALCSPVPLCLEILALGLFLLWCTRRQRAGKTLVTLGFILLAFFSSAAGSRLLLQPLEQRYPPLLNPVAAGAVKWVVVLGGGLNSDPRLPLASHLNGAALHRLVAGVILQRQLPGSKLLLSGGPVLAPPPEAEEMAKLAPLLGVDPREIVLEAHSWDTADQARFIKDIVGRDKMVLVTSASHMLRAMALFHHQGLEPVPAPADYLLHQTPASSLLGYFPDAGNLKGSEAALHEYLGLAWARLRGAI
jgi:uncharacterized SAM-binding protein YcdF (DUF218 family)